MPRHIFKSTTQKLFNKRIFGFDIETYDRNTRISCCSLVGKDLDGNIYQRYFENSNGRDVKVEFLTEIKTNPIFKDSIIFATNLDFDFMGMFFNSDEQKHFHPLRRGNKLLSMKTYFTPKGDFTFFRTNPFTKSKKQYPSLEFRDSLNYAQLSLKQMGEIIGFHKLPTPDFIVDKEVWNKPRTFDDWDALKKYNINDSWVTFYFMEYLFKGYETLGATIKLTQASTSMSLFKNKYLGDYVMHPQPKDVLKLVFKGYYGGRTEAFKRGCFKNCHYYDYNSLYPSVMAQYEFPDPNSMRHTRRDVPNYIVHCEGVSEVTVTVPKMSIPPLPYNIKGKILFPYGTLRGSWSHVELRNAMSCGCTIEKVHDCVYFVRKMRPFKDFAEDLYALRLKYKRNNNKMEYITKILMNSLYGKFGERFDDRTQTYYRDSVTKEMMDKSIKTELIGEDWIDLTESQEPMAHCIPIWAVYVAAYGRVKMHQTMMKHPDIIYCDTDSLITHDTIPTSNKLGDLKLEQDVTEGWVVRPKMYCFIDEEHKEHVKIKGLGMRIDIARFIGLESDPKVLYKRIAKFKEAIRRGYFVPNETISTHKTFSLEDGKRDWKGQKFTFNDFQESDPLRVMNGNLTGSQPEVSEDGNICLNGCEPEGEEETHYEHGSE